MAVHRFKITVDGPSHYGLVGGRRVRFHKTKGLNIVELEYDKHKDNTWGRFGLQDLGPVEPVGKGKVHVATPGSTTKPEGLKSEGDKEPAKEPAKEPEKAPEKEPARVKPVAIPEGWEKLVKARRAALARRITGADHSGASDEVINKVITDYVGGNA